MSPSIKPTISGTWMQVIHLRDGRPHMATGRLRPWDEPRAGMDEPSEVGIGWFILSIYEMIMGYKPHICIYIYICCRLYIYIWFVVWN